MVRMGVPLRGDDIAQLEAAARRSALTRLLSAALKAWASSMAVISKTGPLTRASATGPSFCDIRPWVTM